VHIGKKRSFATKGFSMTSSSMTVKSKIVVHTKVVVLASIASVLSEKWAFQGHLAVLQRLSRRQKHSFATKQLAEWFWRLPRDFQLDDRQE
jgi:hypothetical protein